MNPDPAASCVLHGSGVLAPVTRLVGALALITVAVGTKAQVFDDSLTGSLNSAEWTVSQTTPGLYSVTPQGSGTQLALVGLNPGGLQNVVVNLNLAATGVSLTGDFTAQINFSKAAIGPSNDQVQLNLGFSDGLDYSEVYDLTYGLNVHATSGADSAGFGVSGTSGTLAITRSAGVVAAYFNGGMLLPESDSSALSSLSFSLQNQPGSNDLPSVVFDDFILSSSAGAATQFSVVATAIEQTGVPFAVTVTALDATGATATAYSGTVVISSSDGAATLPATAGLTNGVGTFQVTLHTVGNFTVSATDTAHPSINGASQNIAVVPSSPLLTFVSGQVRTNNIYTSLNEQFPSSGTGTPG